MGERKVLNKYFPPDFDPAKIPKTKRTQSNEMKVRMMLPFSLQCQTCGCYMYKGTKFNTRKEDVIGENYLGIQVYRFYFRCRTCANEITFKTDPKNSDYTAEHGASRNYEPWREADVADAEAKAQREEEERGNAMKALENRTLDSKREMDLLAALDEMRSLKARHERVGVDAALEALQRTATTVEEPDIELNEEDEKVLRSIFSQGGQASIPGGPTQVVRRITDDDARQKRPPRKDSGSGGASGSMQGPNEARDGSNGAALATGLAGSGKVATMTKPTIRPKIVAKRKAAGPIASSTGDQQQQPSSLTAPAAAAQPSAQEAGGGGLGLLGQYGSSGSEDG